VVVVKEIEVLVMEMKMLTLILAEVAEVDTFLSTVMVVLG
jgi:hypothetical protein